MLVRRACLARAAAAPTNRARPPHSRQVYIYCLAAASSVVNFLTWWQGVVAEGRATSFAALPAVVRVLSLLILAAAALLLAFLAVSFVASLLEEGRAEGVAALVGGRADPVALWRRVTEPDGDEWWACDATGASEWDLPIGAVTVDGWVRTLDDALGNASWRRVDGIGGSGGGSGHDPSRAFSVGGRVYSGGSRPQPFVAAAAVEADSVAGPAPAAVHAADAALAAALRSALDAEETREARHAELPHAVAPLQHAAALPGSVAGGGGAAADGVAASPLTAAAAASGRNTAPPDSARAVRDGGIRDAVRALVTSLQAHEAAEVGRKRGARAKRRVSGGATAAAAAPAQGGSTGGQVL